MSVKSGIRVSGGGGGGGHSGPLFQAIGIGRIFFF